MMSRVDTNALTLMSLSICIRMYILSSLIETCTGLSESKQWYVWYWTNHRFFTTMSVQIPFVTNCLHMHRYLTRSIHPISLDRICAEWYASLVSGHDWVTNEILFVLFCSVELGPVHKNIKQDEHQGYDTFGEGRIRVNIVLNGTHKNTYPSCPSNE
jgi:hypothetical protein